jgi:hypothetical protein
MILVKRSATEIADGFAELESFRERLSMGWAPHFMRLFIEQQKKYGKARRAYDGKSWFGRLVSSPPVRPKLVRFSTLYEHLYWPVWLEWVEALRSTPEVEVPVLAGDAPEVAFGKLGEQEMISWLAGRLDDRYLAACRLYMNRVDQADIDVVVVGPQGCWYFEVKNWKGVIRGEGDYDWLQISKYGEEKIKPSPIWVWKKVSNEIINVLSPVWDDPLVQSPVMKPLGGVVFMTDPSECELDIINRSLVRYGFLSPYWEEQLADAPVLKAAKPGLIFKILDALLAKNRGVQPDMNRFSTAVLAKELVSRAEDRLIE